MAKVDPLYKYNLKPNETHEDYLKRLPGDLLKYAIHLDEMIDGKRQIYKEIISLCSLFEIEYDPGTWRLPFWVLPKHETNIKELEDFMYEMNIPYTKHRR